MRFLVDESLSPYIAAMLREEGHDAIHVREAGLAAAPDEQVFALAERDDRTLISADTDFGTFLATLHAPGPSLILFRCSSTDVPAQQVVLLQNLIGTHADDIDRGAILVFDGVRLRIRTLPISSD